MFFLPQAVFIYLSPVFAPSNVVTPNVASSQITGDEDGPNLDCCLQDSPDICIALERSHEGPQVPAAIHAARSGSLWPLASVS